LGTLFITKLKHAVLSRVDTPEDQRRPFFLHIDEFQAFIGDTYALEAFISGSRKFRLGLTLAHQTLDQLPRELRTVILGNVGTKIFFRLSHHDAAQISSEMDHKEKQLIEKRLIDLRVREAYIKEKGQKPRLLKTAFVPSKRVSEDALKRVRLSSFQCWARPVAEVEREIEERKSIWMYDEGEIRVTSRKSNGQSLKDYSTVAPDGLFEEGQDEW
jgi:DNA helicase HerA-like ATPase